MWSSAICTSVQYSNFIIDNLSRHIASKRLVAATLDRIIGQLQFFLRCDHYFLEFEQMDQNWTSQIPFHMRPVILSVDLNEHSTVSVAAPFDAITDRWNVLRFLHQIRGVPSGNRVTATLTHIALDR